MKQTEKKPWFRINKDVEYSTSFKFFRENQIRIVNNGTINDFVSRIEAKKFHTVKSVFRNGEVPQPDADLMLMIIHKEILAGKHGKGTFVK